MTKSRLNKAFELKDNVLKVNDNTYVIPSQTREGKAHIVLISYKDEYISIPIEMVLKAKSLYDQWGDIDRTIQDEHILSLLRDIHEQSILNKQYECTCEDYQYHPTAHCKHILAVQLKYKE